MKKIIIANWKMNKTAEEAVGFARKLKRKIKSKADVVICPGFTALHAVSKELKNSKIKLGAQNMFYEEKGAFTGEISPKMVKGLVEYVILGHSERRAYFNESDKDINKKIKTALKNKIGPILCVGETLKQRRGGKTKIIVKKQLEKCLEGLKKEEFLKIIIAYEPIWAIGTGLNATPEQAEKVHAFIRTFLCKKTGKKNSKNIRIIYGGSANPKNIKALVSMHDIDGALVGGASLDVNLFAKVINLS